MVRDFEHTGYWALILGGSSGLGLASAKKLAKHGMNLCIVHRTPRSEMDDLRFQFDTMRNGNVKVLDFNADAANPIKQHEIIDLMRENLGHEKIRCLLHSIAKGNLKPLIGGLTSDDFSSTIGAMSTSLFEWTKLAHNAGIFAGDARVISFTSEGSHKSWANYAAVSAAKAALESISRSIALEFAPFGIRSNCIMAGITDTRSMRMIPGSDGLLRLSETRNPFARLTNPDDVANAVYLLCRDEAAWINGAVIPVNGGEHLQ